MAKKSKVQQVNVEQVGVAQVNDEPVNVEPVNAEIVAPEAAAEEAASETISAETVSVEATVERAELIEVDVADLTDLAAERPTAGDDAQLRAILEAIVYVTDEPLSAQQIAAALERPIDVVKRCLDELVAEWAKVEHGLAIREVAGGYKMSTKPEHHEAVRAFVKKLTPPLKLSLAALETLAVIAYKQPVTGPEIMEIRGVQGAGVLKTLLDRKLIAESGRKNVVGKPILYKTTKEFLVQFGLKSVGELPTLKEFEELGRMEIAEPDNQTTLPLTEAAAASPEDGSEPPAATETAVPVSSETEAASETETAAETEIDSASKADPEPKADPDIKESNDD